MKSTRALLIHLMLFFISSTPLSAQQLTKLGHAQKSYVFSKETPLLQAQLPRWASQDDETIFLAIKTTIPLDTKQLGRFTKKYQLTIRYQFPDKNLICATLPATQLKALQSDEATALIQALPYEEKAHTDPGQLIHQLNTLQSNIGNKAGLKGKNQMIGVGDFGNVSNHIDFADNIIRFTKDMSYHEHADHVVGILAGGANLNRAYGGVSPESDIVLGLLFDIIANAPLLLKQYSMQFTNNSYGKPYECGSDLNMNVFTEIIDDQLHTHEELLHIFSAGNSGNLNCPGNNGGFGTLSPFLSTAKNGLTVGSIDGSSQIAANSSKGPTIDGRLKPEICAKGVRTTSVTQNNEYTSKSGTSMAAPIVTGTCALLSEAYSLQNQGVYPDGGLLKAILCNTADDLGLPGPDFTYGFGQLNARRAVNCLSNQQYFKSSLAEGETKTFKIEVKETDNQLKVLLYWADIANEMGIYDTHALINDLDIEIQSPSGQILLPWVADASNPGKGASRKKDKINNIEQITLDQPAPGTYTIQVTGPQLLPGAQTFYLTYELRQPEIILTYPLGGEQLISGEKDWIIWDTDPLNEETFKIEFSNDNGQNWLLVANDIPANKRQLEWTIPDQYTEQAKVRITRNTSGLQDSNDAVFYILDEVKGLSTEWDCNDHLRLSWEPSPLVETYEILLFKDNEFHALANSTSNQTVISNIEKNELHWIAIQGTTASGIRLPRTESIRVRPSQALPPLFDITIGASPTCTNAQDGEATIEPVDDRRSYTYLWDNNETGPTAFSLRGGQHEVRISDDWGCVVTERIILPNPSPIQVVVHTDSAHPGQADGSASTEVQGGAAPYMYTWSTAVSPTSDAAIDQLASGDYSLTLTDDNGCELAQTFTIEELLVDDLPNVAKGIFSIFPNPSRGPVQIEWPDNGQQPLEVQVFDLAGRLAKQEVINSQLTGRFTSDWSKLAAGQYVVHLIFKDTQLTQNWVKIN